MVIAQPQPQIRNQRRREAHHRIGHLLRFAQMKLRPLNRALAQRRHNLAAHALIERTHLPERLRRAQQPQTSQQKLQPMQRGRMQRRKDIPMSSDLIERLVHEPCHRVGQPQFQILGQWLRLRLIPQTIDIGQQTMYDFRIERCAAIHLNDGDETVCAVCIRNEAKWGWGFMCEREIQSKQLTYIAAAYYVTFIERYKIPKRHALQQTHPLHTHKFHVLTLHILLETFRSIFDMHIGKDTRGARFFQKKLFG